MAETAQAPGSGGGAAGQHENTAYRHGWARIDNRIVTQFGPRIGAVGLALYLVLSVHADARTRTCFPSMRTISRYLQVSRPTVIKTIHTLEALGLVKVTRARTPQGSRRVNVYTLLPIPDGQPALPPEGNDVAQKGDNVKPALPLLVNDVAHNGHNVKPALPPLVNDVAHPGKPGLPEQDLINKTHENKRGCA